MVLVLVLMSQSLREGATYNCQSCDENNVNYDEGDYCVKAISTLIIMMYHIHVVGRIGIEEKHCITNDVCCEQ